MEEVIEILGELLLTAVITKEKIYFLIFLLGFLGIGAYFYFS